MGKMRICLKKRSTDYYQFFLDSKKQRLSKISPVIAIRLVGTLYLSKWYGCGFLDRKSWYQT